MRISKFLFLSFIFCSCTTVTVDEFENKENSEIFLSVQDPICLEDSYETRGFMRIPEGNSFNYYFSYNDSIGIFPSAGYQIPFVIRTDANGNTIGEEGYYGGVKIDAGAWRTNSAYTYTCYLPFDYDNKSGNALPVDYSGQVQKGNNGLSHLTKYTLLVSDPSTYDEETNKFNFVLKDIAAIARLKITVPTTATYRKVVLATKNGDKVFTVKAKYNAFADADKFYDKVMSSSVSMVLQGNDSSVSKEINQQGISLAAGTQLIVNLRLGQVDLRNTTVVAKLYDSENNIYTTEKTLSSAQNLLAANYVGWTFGGNGSSSTTYVTTSASDNSNPTNLNSDLSSKSSEQDLELLVQGTGTISNIEIPKGILETADASVTLNFENVPSSGTADNMITIAEPTVLGDISTHTDVEIAIPSAKENNADVPSLTILLPHSTVTLSAVNGAAEYSTVNSTTAENTLVIESGVVVTNLHIYGGNVIIKEGAIVYNIFDHTGGKSSITNWNDGGSTDGEVNAEISGFQSGN